MKDVSTFDATNKSRPFLHSILLNVICKKSATFTGNHEERNEWKRMLKQVKVYVKIYSHSLIINNMVHDENFFAFGVNMLVSSKISNSSNCEIVLNIIREFFLYAILKSPTKRARQLLLLWAVYPFIRFREAL